MNDEAKNQLIRAYPVIEEFLVNIVRELPEEHAREVESFRRIRGNIKHHIEAALSHLSRVEADLRSLQRELEPFNQSISRAADTATKITVIDPLVEYLNRILEEKGDDE